MYASCPVVLGNSANVHSSLKLGFLRLNPMLFGESFCLAPQWRLCAPWPRAASISIGVQEEVGSVLGARAMPMGHTANTSCLAESWD